MTPLSPSPIVQVEGLTRQVTGPEGVLLILQDVSFSVMPGEACAIIGASGSGKTTLLGLLAGLDVPSSGRVLLDGVDLFALNEDARAQLRGRMIGFVFQTFQLLPALTALENVMLPLELAGRSKEARDAAREVLERVGLGARLHHTPVQLSGGEQQRVAIARAFATRPKLLLADEPTGNLDQVTGERIIDLLFELNRAQHSTLLLVTHDEQLAQRCNRRLKLDAGRLVNQESQSKATLL
ncbi:MAG: ATP-binding cassette domain-containing protein [Proteobacteria bacterium]|nr:ATP-binding cassette domain-containing protein [Pseudomonadota bacterium]